MAKRSDPGQITADKLELYERLVAAEPNVERKGATMPYTSANGHMFSFLSNAGALALRLPAAEREAFVKKFGARLCEQHGRILRDYVEVPDALLEKTQTLQAYFALSLAYVSSLKPKPTARKPKTAKTAKKGPAGESSLSKKRAK